MLSGHGRSRRDFLASLTAAGLTGALRPSLAAAETNDIEFPARGAPLRRERHRAVVIGSGMGGAVAALRLAEAGIDTVVLERGRRWPLTPAMDTFPSYKKPDGRISWFRRKPVLPLVPLRFFKPYPGLYERIDGSGIDVIVGSGVGGSSLLFGGIMIQPPRGIFERIFPPCIDYGEMARVYYPRVRDTIGFGTIPDDVLAHPQYLSSRIFQAHAAAAGLETERIHCSIDWNVVRDELAGRAPKCLSVGEYMYGANNGAKYSVDRNYLARAEKSGRAEVRPLHVVQTISEGSCSRFEVVAHRIDEEGRVVERVAIACDQLFMAAGSMGTSRMLVEARETGRLPRLGPEVGAHWGNNGERLFMRFGLGERTGARHGGPPPVGTFFNSTPHGPVSLELAAAPFPIELHAMMVVGISLPEASGRFLYDRRTGRVRLHWPREAGAGAVRAIRSLVRRIEDHSDSGILIDFDALTGNVTYHPCGGVVLGKACDADGRVRGYEGLYVVDAAVIPGAAGCGNPAWTVAALAERCMDRVLEDT